MALTCCVCCTDSSADETTEFDADVMNSLPMWAQAVVQTGCFNGELMAAMLEHYHGKRPSSASRLKRSRELQEEHDPKQPRKRRSLSSRVNDAESMVDERSELQDCLDELNRAPDADVEMFDDEVIPTFTTQAEIAADTVEKYVELLVRLIDNATHRQLLENFERDNMDVFLPEEVKLLLQTMKALEKREWINKLDADLLVSLISAFDNQVRLGLTVDVLGATMPISEKGKSQPSTIDGQLVSRLLATLDIAICELILMTTPQVDRRLLSEDNIDHCFQLLHRIIRRLLLPCIDTTYVTTASIPIVEGNGRRQAPGPKTSSSSRINLRANQHIRKTIDRVAHVFCEFMDQLAVLVSNVKLGDQWVLPLTASMVELFALEHSQYATSLQQSALTIMRRVFLQYRSHRESLLGDIVGVMIKLPTAKRTLRTVKLINSSDLVQRISTLVVSMIQACAPAGKLGAETVLQDAPQTLAVGDEDKPLQKKDIIEVALEEVRSSAISLVRVLLKVCWKKSEERDNRVVLENFVEDLLVMFVHPEWAGAEDILEVLCASLASILHANISTDVKNPDSQKSLAALSLVGKICASIKRYQKKSSQTSLAEDSDSTIVVEEHVNNIRVAVSGKTTRSRNPLKTANSELFQNLALKHIVVMHLQRSSFDWHDSRKLLLLKFMSEAKSNWAGVDLACAEREHEVWKSLWEEPEGVTKSTFKVAIPSTDLAMKSSLRLAVNRRFCGLFDSLLAHIMALLSKGMPSLRARVMKCLRGIVDVDPLLMAETGVQSAVQRCCSDEKPSVREAAVDLIGTYVLLQPLLFDKYFDVLAERVRDKGIKVRKSVCKIFKVALISMQEQLRDPTSKHELHRKSACMRALVERIGDASEDQAVKNFIIDTFQEVWFGAELSSSRLSNPLSEFGDGSTLPPGWNTVISTAEDKNNSTDASPRFVSEDGVAANSVEEAWSLYRTPTVTPASVVKINDSKMDNSSEVVATIVEVIHGMPNLGWFAELLKRLLREHSSDGSKNAMMRSTKSRSTEVAIAEDRSEKIIDRLVDCLMDLQEGILLKGVSIKDGHEQFVSCMIALSVFCEAKPQLLARHLETLRVYLKEQDVKIQSLSVSMIDNILSVKRVSQSIASRLEDDLKVLILRSPPSVVGPSIKCLATLSTTRKKVPVLLLELLERFVLVIRQYRHITSLASLSEQDNFNLQRSLFAAGKIVGATNIDNVQQLASETKILQIGVITESLYELYKQFVQAPGNDNCSAKAVQGMGFLFPIRPRLFLRAQQDQLLKHLLTSTPGKKTLQCLVSMKELLLSEEQRLENGLATRLMDRSKSKEQQVQGDQEADASLIGNVMQAELDSILILSLQKIPQIRKEAVACIGVLLTQGLVNPLQCIQNLVALETDRVSDVRDAAFSQLLAVYERFPSQFHTPLIQGIQKSYSFQLNVYGNATSLGIDDNNKEYCLFGRLYTNCLKPAKSYESLFFKALVNQFTDQGIVLKQLNIRSASQNSKTFTSNLKYLCYLAQIISTLPYDVEDEPLYIIYLVNRYAFAKAGVAPDQLEDDEADISKINIGEYRRLDSLSSAKLAVLKINGCIAFAIALMLRLKFTLKHNYHLDDEKCATYKPSAREPPVEARERSPKKLLLPSVDDLCQTDDSIELTWNLFVAAWFAARKDQKQLDIDLENQVKLKSSPKSKPKASPKRRRRSSRLVVAKRLSSDNDSEQEEYVGGFA
ncbi:unnamed protein product [Phytophthora fragariaefolia]|uniref:Sister chromatid cohesion protein n=1 Tax=Phytophthora fragariaefolia TaxID=1490495 RepID=A0A9W6XNA4_9STRA|nr:unnamed protein product [Phytophthora fragariaefolia]